MAGARKLVRAFVVLALLAGCSSNTTVTVAPPAATDGEGAQTPGDEGEATEPVCPVAGKPSSAGRVDGADVKEASGIVASSVNEGVYWVHNDSGDVARAFALSSEGKLLTTLSFSKSAAIDIEDVAVEDVGPGSSYLYFGDIGDNDAVRPSIKIFRVAEPTLGADTALTVTSDVMTVTYPDGARNAETLLFDPLTKELLIATKASGGPSEIHRVGAFTPGTKVTTEKIAEVDIDLATGGDISRDGKFIAIRNYTTTAFVWVRGQDESIADALSRAPCKVPVATENQGEAFAFLLENKGYVTLSEGASQSLNVALFE